MIRLLRLCLLKLHKRPRLTASQDSISTPLGHVSGNHHLPGDYRLTITRIVNTHASLDEGVARARVRRYVPRGDE